MVNTVLVLPFRGNTEQEPFFGGSLTTKTSALELVSVGNRYTTSNRQYVIEEFDMNKSLVAVKLLEFEPRYRRSHVDGTIDGCARLTKEPDILILSHRGIACPFYGVRRHIYRSLICSPGHIHDRAAAARR